ncbi:hypothetical protein [Roseivirga misakiensis]|uniref:Uncharacterized protein n=1 Tax=Roseivirga misakiensis TaxID=1563681 RepID=A0A1E5T5S9_9BACT|nr:hypothetical protein [Roseivirga misakiensis]OEK06706.1 hypothetical protein BFP71_03325 [Roseivirga misakiensis]
MFDGPDYRKSLDEDVFDEWLEAGRSSKLNSEFMLVVWDDQDQNYYPEYVRDRAAIETSGLEYYGQTNDIRSVVAIYHLYSESRVSFG